MSVKIRERKPGEWWVFVDHNNKRKAKKIGTKEAAERIQKQIEARLALGDLGILAPKEPTKPDPTFKEYQKTWLERLAAKRKDSTVAYYKDYQERYIIPRFGSLRLSEITAARIEMMVGELKTKTLAPNTIRLAFASLRSVLSTAVRDKLLAENPAKGLGITSNKANRVARSMEPDEAARFLAAASEGEYYPLFFVALRAGLRQGEILALRWSDIDFTKNLIRVERRWYRGTFDSPKGKRTRYVEMSLQLKAALQYLQTQRTKNSELLFPGSNLTQPISVRSLVENWFEPALKKAELSGFTFHDLRHTYGSLLLDAGAPLSYVKDQMGHASIAITAEVYAHSLRKNSGFVNKLDQQLPQLAATQPQPEAQPENPKSASDWCERGDSNPHGFTRQILSLVRLPIPPLSHSQK
jgi:integrase